MNLEEKERERKIAFVLDLSWSVEAFKGEIKRLQDQMNVQKEEIRKIMLDELKEKKLQNDQIEIGVRTRNSFDMDIVEFNYPKLYEKYMETKQIEVEEFNTDQFKQDHPEEFALCFKAGTPGIYIKKR